MPPGSGVLCRERPCGKALLCEIPFGPVLGVARLRCAWAHSAPPSPSRLRGEALRFQALSSQAQRKRFAPMTRTAIGITPARAARMLTDAVTTMGEDGVPLMLRVLGNGTPEICKRSLSPTLRV